MTKEQAHEFIDQMFSDSSVALMVIHDQDWCFKSVTGEIVDGKMSYTCIAQSGPRTWREFLSRYDWNIKGMEIPENLKGKERLDWVRLQTRMIEQPTQ